MTSQKHDHSSYDQFIRNFDMAYETIQRVSLPNLKLFGSTKRELWVKNEKRVMGEKRKESYG